MNYYNEIKKELIDNEVYKRIKDYSKNKYELERYYNVGKLLVEAQGGEARAKYGDGLIKEYSKKLTNDLGYGYTSSALKRMRQFYLLIQKGATMSHLSWSHYVELLKFDNILQFNYYVNISVRYNLSVRELRNKIRNREYERLDKDTRGNLSIEKNNNEIKNYIKHPIMIKNRYNFELGDGFTFIKSEYKIKFEDRYNYIDILLFNIEFNCYVVVELKVTELKKEHIGQIQVYMNYIDRNVKKIDHDKTVGIIIAKKDNKFVMEYCSSNKILRTTYELV